MEDKFKPSIYLNALKSKPLRDIKIHATPKQNALKDQKGKCIKCGKELKPYLFKYIQDPTLKKMTAICSDCAIPSVKKRI